MTVKNLLYAIANPKEAVWPAEKRDLVKKPEKQTLVSERRDA